MKVVNTLATVLGLAAFAHGHMEMTSPPPFRSKHNPNTGSDIDYSITSPLSGGGDNFPCKGYHKLLGTKQGASVATWTPGQTYQFGLTGSANHEGGSCQASLSYDQGKTWKVIHSYIGGCPVSGVSSLSFKLPSDAPSGEAMFAWTWFNRVGNREMYMDCAAVTIKGGKKRASSEAFKNRPDLFVANVGNNVCTVANKDVEFPNPGPDVTRNGQDTAPPSCEGTEGGGGGGGGGSGAYNPGNRQSSTQAAGAVFVTTPGHSATSTSSSSSSAATTTVSVSIRPTATPSSNPAPSSNGDNSSSSISSSTTTAGSRCEKEGLWNCLADGAHFQRCASGVWSAILPVAPGTTCQPGLGDSFVVMKKKRGEAGSGWRRHAGHQGVHAGHF